MQDKIKDFSQYTISLSVSQSLVDNMPISLNFFENISWIIESVIYCHLNKAVSKN